MGVHGELLVETRREPINSNFPDNSLLFPVPFLGKIFWNPITMGQSRGFQRISAPKSQKFPVFSLLNREIAENGSAQTDTATTLFLILR